MWIGAKTLEFSSDVQKTFHYFRQIDPQQTEAGGQLFGSLLGDTVKVTLATYPHPTDTRSRTSIERTQIVEQNEINEAFKSGMHYFGDWHTHPQARPLPSGIDKNNAKHLFQKSKTELTDFLMVIVGTTLATDNLYVAIVNSRRIRKLRKLCNVNFGNQ